MRYIAEKGSIAVDACSLTVNGVDGGRVPCDADPAHAVCHCVPLSGARATWSTLEVDMVARYLERLASFRGAEEQT
jgi:riboflavin synthase